MGILNVTPDSFSDGGRYTTVETAVRHAARMIEDGADLIDIGGESTRPGSTAVSAEEELERVVPVVAAIAARFDIAISVDTYKAVVARQALDAGAHIINDIWGLKADSQMAEVAAQAGCPVILMHNRHKAEYADLICDMIGDLRESIRLAHAAGIADGHIVLDPGIGFGKTLEHNLAVMNRLKSLTGLGYPVLLATSRKSMIQKVLGLPAADTLEGTAATVAVGIAAGCEIVRVHDVKEMKRVAAMTDAMIRR